MDHRKYTYPGDLLEGRIILITGASDGIGRALAIHAAAHGAQVILHGRNARKLESVYDEIESLQGAPRPSIAVLDLASAGSDSSLRYSWSPASQTMCLPAPGPFSPR